MRVPSQEVRDLLIKSGMTSGAVELYDNAWNLAWLGGRVALVDVTLPTSKGPLIVVRYRDSFALVAMHCNAVQWDSRGVRCRTR